MAKTQHPVQVRIPEPCSENFSAMPPVDGGRYCGQCSKVITDFTKMTDAQLIDWMRNHRGGCGTFRPDQLNRDLIEPVVRKAPFGAGWLLSLLIMTGCIRENGAKKGAIPEQVQTLGEPVAVLPQDARLKNDSVTVKEPVQRKPETEQIREPYQEVMGGVPVEVEWETARQVVTGKPALPDTLRNVPEPAIMGDFAPPPPDTTAPKPKPSKGLWGRLWKR